MTAAEAVQSSSIESWKGRGARGCLTACSSGRTVGFSPATPEALKAGYAGVKAIEDKIYG